ncbi:MAG TPA: hypothetical protein VM695_04450 [Phycisphaerae bacterium]|nr:hypothetical protein [Phycisphaerae bacterium]
MPGALIAVFVAVFVLVAIFGILQAQARRKEMLAFAQRRGLTFDPGKYHGLDDRFPAFDCLRRGHGRYAHNRVFGDWNGRDCLLFDYRYVTGSGKNRHTHHFSAIILASDVPLKPLLIRPEGFFDKIADFFGFDDIDFESAEFSREFCVKGPDRKWAYDVIHQRTMEFLMSGPRYSIEFDPAHVIVWHTSRFSVPQFPSAVELAEGLLDLLPEYVRRKQEGAAR